MTDFDNLETALNPKDGSSYKGCGSTARESRCSRTDAGSQGRTDSFGPKNRTRETNDMTRRSSSRFLVSIGIIALGVPTASLADNLVNLEDLREMADFLGKLGAA